jgi:hypothetical protein
VKATSLHGAKSLFRAFTAWKAELGTFCLTLLTNAANLTARNNHQANRPRLRQPPQLPLTDSVVHGTPSAVLNTRTTPKVEAPLCARNTMVLKFPQCAPADVDAHHCAEPLCEERG